MGFWVKLMIRYEDEKLLQVAKLVAKVFDTEEKK
jgi:hypothetical protein